MAFTVAPLKSSFMAASIVGFFISILLVFKYSPSFGFAFAIVFFTMFIASIISMTYAPLDETTKYEVVYHGEDIHVNESKKPKTKPTSRKKKAVNKFFFNKPKKSLKKSPKKRK